jgi:hypothetical protein
MPPLVIDLFRNDMLHDYRDGYAREWAAYRARLRAVEALAPDRPNTQGGQDPVVLLDEATVALVTTAWLAGAEVGAAFAEAARALDYDVRICQSCDGNGRRRGEDGACPTCGGTGTVPPARD